MSIVAPTKPSLSLLEYSLKVNYNSPAFMTLTFVSHARTDYCFQTVPCAVDIQDVQFAGVLDVQNILSADVGISRQTKGHSLGDHMG
jgi:hypothetical protein